MEPGRREAPAGRRVRTTREPPFGSSTGSNSDADELVAEFDRLYVPRNDGRWLHRNALDRRREHRNGGLAAGVERYCASTTRPRRRPPIWALERIAGREA